MIKKADQISLDEISYKINDKFFFDKISLDFSCKGITIILGPNGSGKTLLTKILKGLVKPSSGKLIIKLNNHRPNIGYMSQNVTFLRRNVYKNLSYPLEIKGIDKKIVKEKIKFFMESFKFSGREKVSARRLSKGNKQYLSFIRTLVTQPNLLILDEPSSNLDMKSTKTIEKYLVKEKRNKKIIMVTHDLFQAKRLADEIIFINEGKIIKIFPKKKFLNSPNKIVQKFLDGGLF